MPLLVQADGTISEGPVPSGGSLVLVLLNGVVQEAYIQAGGGQEISFPSYISSSDVYTPSGNLAQAGVTLVNGRVVLDTVIQEVTGNV